MNTGERMRLVLTGEHEVRTSEGAVLRFFLARGPLANPDTVWERATDAEFQHAYELALFDPQGLDAQLLLPNPHRMQLALDALMGPGSFFWSDGADVSGVLTTNGKAPEECGFGLATAQASARVDGDGDGDGDADAGGAA
ncbi:hypothetical protein H8N01_17260 [Streptomyces sp. AC536]|uniref:hypothetical protein n=1 Tax=Streptomyces buecherae TaxID=2763006 RepID=UPI00164EA03E|nr:hypothetical protein [Streptomyces buecherae]MBC3984267.1 hypothetical protein [Streptomyces buecherae]QNJ41047.1 hypothetical protein H7H31_15420 [Streptomyces buecherae]